MSLKPCSLLLPALFGLLCVLHDARAQNGVIYADYAGRSNAGTALLPPGTPTFANPALGGSDGLLPLHQTAGVSAIRTGTESNLDWPQEAPRLCASYGEGSDTPSAVAACNRRIMGRVFYTVVRMPVAGNIGFYIAHDDDARVDLSSDFQIGANYQGAQWDLPVGALSSYTSDSNTFARIGSVTSPAVGSCLLMRVAWANAGGRNFMRLGYRTTATGATQFFAQENLISPLNTARIAQVCQGAVQAAPTVQLNKVISGGRVQPADQFAVSLRQDDVALASGTTSGTGASLGLPVTTVAAGATSVVTLQETAASGSLTPYVASASCTASTAGGTSGPLPLTDTSTGAIRRWQLPALSAGQQVTCTITNRAANAALSLSKTSSPEGVWRQGQAVTYTLTARNNGPDAANGSVIRDPAVSGLNCTTLSCQASGNAVCPAAPLSVAGLQGNGLLVPTFPANSQLVLTLGCSVTATGTVP